MSRLMSAFGTQRTSQCIQAMSALRGKADIANTTTQSGPGHRQNRIPMELASSLNSQTASTANSSEEINLMMRRRITADIQRSQPGVHFGFDDGGGFFNPASRAFAALRLSAYSLPSIGATCGGSLSRYGRPIPSSFSCASIHFHKMSLHMHLSARVSPFTRLSARLSDPSTRSPR